MSDMEKINALSEKIETMQKQAVNSTKVNAIVYLSVVLFVFGYTAYIMNWIKEEVTIDNIVDFSQVRIVNDLLSDENCRYWMVECKKQAPALAEYLVEVTHQQAIPLLKNKIKLGIDKTSDEAIKRLKKDIFPGIKKLVLENAKELNKHKDITDQNIANELAIIVADECEREMDIFINDKVKRRISLLRDELDELSSKPYDKLSNEEKSKRLLIVNWIYLLEHDESPADALGEFLKSLNNTYEDALKDLTLSD